MARMKSWLNQRRLKQYMGSSAARSVTQKYSRLEWWATGWYSAQIQPQAKAEVSSL